MDGEEREGPTIKEEREGVRKLVEDLQKEIGPLTLEERIKMAKESELQRMQKDTDVEDGKGPNIRDAFGRQKPSERLRKLKEK